MSVLTIACPYDKARAVLALDKIEYTKDMPEPVMPANLELVPASGVPRRRLGTPKGQAALFHSLAHIEFNAIHLALDAAMRFDMPDSFREDWLFVAKDEARHFLMLDEHLKSFGMSYGDLPAHNGLWDMAVKTKHDVLARMAMVPRLLEARGLDVSLDIARRLADLGDKKGAEILQVIHDEEIDHVSIGNKWYKYICEVRGVCYMQTFMQYLQEYGVGPIRKPLNHESRLKAGFAQDELDYLESVTV